VKHPHHDSRKYFLNGHGTRKKMDPKAFEKPGVDTEKPQRERWATAASHGFESRSRETDRRYNYFFKLNSGT
jgi:exopolysaccharide biosynthesis protein